MTNIDFNVLEHQALIFTEQGQTQKALELYLFMAEGDQSLDGGYLGWRLGQCYESQGRLREARYWYRRGLEENPVVMEIHCGEPLRRIGELPIDYLLGE